MLSQVIRFTDKKTGRKFESSPSSNLNGCASCCFKTGAQGGWKFRLCMRVVGYGCVEHQVVFKEVQ